MKFYARSSQMNYRLKNGKGTAYYYIGLADDGTKIGLKYEDMLASLENLVGLTMYLKAFKVKPTLLEIQGGCVGLIAIVKIEGELNDLNDGFLNDFFEL